MNLLVLTLSAMLTAATATTPNPDVLDEVLSAYVHDGLVDYAGLKANRATLDTYLTTAGEVPVNTFQQWNKDTQLAFLINVYNATTLQLIIDHYPVKSIKSIGSVFKSPWSQDSVTLFGKKISLDTLEHKIIRKNYVEPRIHFALVCAAMGCPPLRDEAFRGETLNAQLDNQTRTFLQTTEKNRVDHDKKSLHLSPIFKWYREDFEKSDRSLQAYVAPYLASEVSLEGYDLSFTDYDWDLNQQPTDGK